MRKTVFFLGVLAVATGTVLGQGKPAHGNLSLHFGGMLGHTSALTTSGYSGFVEDAIGSYLGLEKHYGNWFSLTGEYGYAAQLSSFTTPFTFRHLSLVPTLNLRSNSRFVFSFGARSMWGLFAPSNRPFKPAYGFNQVFRFRILLGNKKTYKSNYRGEFNIIVEPFYFRHGYDNQGFGPRFSRVRQFRLQLVLPLIK